MNYNIISFDNIQISVSKDIINFSSFILNLIDTNNINEQPIHLIHDSCTHIKLNLIFDFLNHYTTNKEIDENFNYYYFNNISDHLLFELLITANYLDIEFLLDSICNHITNIIRNCQTPLQVRNRFNIKNDITHDEQMEINNIYNNIFL